MVPGSGFNFEETTPAYLAEIKADVEYLLRSTNLSSQSINLPLMGLLLTYVLNGAGMPRRAVLKSAVMT